jgi:predicted lipoprotein with Yx(FWY)xxD motif
MKLQHLMPLALAAGSTAFAAAPPTTPVGVTLVEVVRELGNSQPQVLWERPGDSNGHTVLSYAKDDAKNARCTDACAAEYPPLLAVKGARPTGDWTLLKRPEGMQWVYQGHPLYTWSKETNPGEVATNIGLNETANSKLAEEVIKATSLIPPEEWTVVRFTPAAKMALPDGIDAREVFSMQAVSLTDLNGHTLYAFNGDAKKDNQTCTSSGCSITWKPFIAPSLATNFGDFTVVSRADGAQQWAYKKRPLYTYTGDLLPGDAHGANVDKNWSVAVLTENFHPANVDVVALEGYGDTLAVNGMTLYGGYAFGKRWGGRNLRDTFKDAYHKGKELGATACDDSECLKSWHPFLASADAQPSGFWEPIPRADGTRQWAYKGFAMYTFAGDKARGDHTGQAVYDFKHPEGDIEYLKKVAFYEKIGKANGGAGIYWNIAKP